MANLTSPRKLRNGCKSLAKMVKAVELAQNTARHYEGQERVWLVDAEGINGSPRGLHVVAAKSWDEISASQPDATIYGLREFTRGE